jgi:hypothetical protein
MKMNRFVGPVLLSGVVSLVAGCVEHRTTYVPVYPTQPPPAVAPAPIVVASAPVVVAPTLPPKPPVELIPMGPGPAYAWVPGHWVWQGRWVWVGGRYVPRPRPHAIWVAGHWGRHGGGYVWVNGYWR